ncbi:bifunctional cobalt-precorrin-7 (C(5))-methyltransferase/cobalt-precorrin-6B (C(15))-methyltransferase [Simplicispira psychrophila]|uniref:bifunctional cobalt-precorrin-7 (C(5))-methyltransferase/cobalt-precorrin-6B (C(15))-methyltransferase n=1 Tax=Simplicispira psychrophila TaxID=80882 RepID=UPI0004865AC7|nr:bifunctional cobalt-precorrin-7 (C(5))-methyltransferase/cobalt-precorrin-6B (C(15))-methyltransferase [Simplicispira psychrophila]
MSEPWLSIIGLGEEGLAGLGDASRLALNAAEMVFGGPRHLALAEVGTRGRAWPVPFDVAPVLALRGQRVAVLASGDPFWFGVGGSLSAHLSPAEWQVFPAPSTFSLAAARLGWRLEDTACWGLHATPFAHTRRALHPGQRLICLLRDGAAVGEFARWLAEHGFGASDLWVLEALCGPSERLRQTTAAGFDFADVTPPVAVALQVAGAAGLPRSTGLPDSGFAHDGQITKSPVRALTLAALAPRPGLHLWDIGAGSGSVSVEWCLAGGHASAIEQHAERVAHIRRNGDSFGLGKSLRVIEGLAPNALDGLAPPAAIFVGGGFNAALFEVLKTVAPSDCRLVVNAVTLETEALLMSLHASHGGELLRIELAHAAPLGRMRGWVPARPVVQWSAVL